LTKTGGNGASGFLGSEVGRVLGRPVDEVLDLPLTEGGPGTDTRGVVLGKGNGGAKGLSGELEIDEARPRKEQDESDKVGLEDRDREGVLAPNRQGGVAAVV
jgi:hypothetical protein